MEESISLKIGRLKIENQVKEMCRRMTIFFEFWEKDALSFDSNSKKFIWIRIFHLVAGNKSKIVKKFGWVFELLDQMS